MRLVIDFSMSYNKITTDYRFSCLSYIKSLLNKEYEETFEKMYAEASIKALTFNMYFPNAKMGKDYIIVAGKSCKLIISAFDDALLMKLYNACVRHLGKEFTFHGGLLIKAKSAQFTDMLKILGAKIKIKMLSPILVRKHSENSNDDEYLTFEDSEFEKYINYSVQRLANACGVVFSPITIEPIKAKITSVKLQDFYYRANYGEFILSGARDMLRLLYASGIGSRRSQGFGMFDCIEVTA